jgi:hypothetical protein
LLNALVCASSRSVEMERSYRASTKNQFEISLTVAVSLPVESLRVRP